MSVEQALKRSGRYDLAVTFTTSPEYKMLLHSIKEELQVEDAVKDKFAFSDTATTMTYAFTDLDPATDTRLFKEKASVGTPNSMAAAGGPGLEALEPGRTELEKRTSFPYHVYTYTIRVAPPQQETPSPTYLRPQDYVQDAAALLAPETEAAIMEDIRAIFANDSVEVIVMTKPALSAAEYWQVRNDLEASFPFKNPDQNYVLLLASSDGDRYCKLDWSFYDPGVAGALGTLGAEYAAGCAGDPGGQITRAVSGLRALFDEKDLAGGALDPSLENQLGQLFTIEYTVRTFGAVVETNGRLLEDGRVRFDINPLKPAEYMVTFKDLVFAGIFVDSLQAVLVVAVVLLVGGNALLLVARRRRRSAAAGPAAPDPQLVNYIRYARSAGKADAEIREMLLTIGWPADKVNASFGQVAALQVSGP